MLVLALIIFGGIFYYCIRNSRRYRIIETNIGGISYYTPQVKINSIWLNIIDVYVGNKGYEYFISAYNDRGSAAYKLDPQDALELIDKFKSAGNYTIPSNQRLKSNQKAIKVE